MACVVLCPATVSHLSEPPGSCKYYWAKGKVLFGVSPCRVFVPQTLETSVTTDPGNSSSFAFFLDVNMVIYKVVRSTVVATPPVRPPLRPCPKLSSQPRSRPPLQALTSQCCGGSWELGAPWGRATGGRSCVMGRMPSWGPHSDPQKGRKGENCPLHGAPSGLGV